MLAGRQSFRILLSAVLLLQVCVFAFHDAGFGDLHREVGFQKSAAGEVALRAVDGRSSRSHAECLLCQFGTSVSRLMIGVTALVLRAVYLPVLFAVLSIFLPPGVRLRAAVPRAPPVCFSFLL